MFYDERFEDQNKFGKIAENKVAILLSSRGHLVEDASNDFVEGDLKVTMKDTKEIRYIEVKHQNCISNNNIIIECYTPGNKNGWFFKDYRVTDYCFYLNDRYIFVGKDGLHRYIGIYADVLGNDRKRKYQLWKDRKGFSLLTVDIAHLSKWCDENNVYFQSITYDLRKF